MSVEIVDRYLLGEPVSKPDVVAAVLAERSPLPQAQPFYRAFEFMGAKIADEALVALRLVLAGKPADDEAVRHLRAVAGVARAARTGDRKSVEALMQRDAGALAGLPAEDLDSADGLARLGDAAALVYALSLR